jgi:hypothetical protein
MYRRSQWAKLAKNNTIIDSFEQKGLMASAFNEIYGDTFVQNTL